MAKMTIPRVATGIFFRRAPLAYLIIWVLSPPLSYGDGWRALAAFSMLLWLAADTLSPRSVLLRPSWPVLGCLAFAIYTLFVRWLEPDGTTVNTQFQLWIMFFFLLVGESFRRGRDGDARFCFWLILCVLPVWMLATLWGVQTLAADAARTVVRSSEEARELMEQGVGGYTLVYAAVLCLPFLTQLAFRSRIEASTSQTHWKRMAKRALVMFNFALVVLLILRAGYSIALILSAVVVLSVMLVGARSILPLAVSLLSIGLIVLMLSIAYKPVLGYLEQAAAGTEYSAKFRDLRTSAEEGSGAGTLEDRAERYYKSLRAFFSNPVIGTLKFSDTGKHSSILDRFAQYGFAVGLLFLALIIHVPLRTLSDRRVPIGLAVGFLAVAVGFPLVNNVFMAWGLMLFVFSRGAFAVLSPPLSNAQHTYAIGPHPAHA